MTENTIHPDIDNLLFKIARENGIDKPRLDVSACSEAGDNFVGKVQRVILTDENDEKKRMHLIAKTPPVCKQRRELLKVDIFFQNEARVYEKILPALGERYKQRGLMEKDAPFLNAPRAYGSITEGGDSDVIILEDMRPRGFVMGDRRKGLDGEHCRLVVRELARLHAASLELQKRDPDRHKNLVDQLTENVFGERDEKEKQEWPVEIYSSRCRDQIKDRFPEGTVERSKFEEFSKNFVDYMHSCVQRDSELRCITHSDAWINNLLFTHNKETSKPDKVCLIDFQITRFASPALDLSYFIFVSTTKAVRDEHYDELIKGYHEDLSKFLEDLGMDANEIAPWDVLQKELKKFGGYGWGMAMLVIPLFLAAQEDIVGVDEELSVKDLESMFVKSSSKNTAMEERLSDVLQDVVRFGFI